MTTTSKLLGEEWASFLPKAEEHLTYTRTILTEELKSGFTIYPQKENIFRIFREIPPSKVNVIWLGQDPYHNKGQATGRSFECGKHPSPSWRKIAEVYKREVADCDPYIVNGSLDKWVQSGVFLLNKSLTVREGMPNSHTKIWEPFTRHVLSCLLNDIANPKAVILLGAEAQKMVPSSIAPHKTFSYEHPAAASYQGRPWRGDGLFKEVEKFTKFHSKQFNW
jgi:uracil-DNA glycosylase